MKATFCLALIVSALAGFGCASVPHGRLAADLTSVDRMVPAPTPMTRAMGAIQVGIASFYHSSLVGNLTANGERYDEGALTAAHRTLGLGTRVRVTNLENQRSVEVVVNDRGPFVSGRIADLSEAAARRIGMIAKGVVEALLDILKPGKKTPGAQDD